MTEITAEWLNAKLEGMPRGSKAKLAKHANIEPKQLSYILNGTRRMQIEEAAAFASFFGEEVRLAGKPIAQARGFREDLTPFEPGRHDAGQHLDRLARALLPAGGRLALARLSRPAPSLAAMAGDIICLDTATRATTSQTLACQVVDEMTASARTMFALAAPGGPIALPGEVPAKNGERVTTVGAVIGLMRGMS